MRRPSTTMRNWLQAATPSQARELAKAADTSVAHLRHIAAGRRAVSADLAQRLAHASTIFKGEMPVIDQRDLCEACGKCELAK